MLQNARLSFAGVVVVILAAAIGTALALYAYLTPMTGVTGTFGAALVVATSILLLLDGVILWLRPRGPAFWLLAVLGVLGAVGTFAAAWFLHEWLLMLAIAGVLIGLALSMLRRPLPRFSREY